jgi:hypothetical protein
MLTMIALAAMLAAGLAVALVVGLIFFVVKVVLWAVFLPFRILFKLLWIPFGLVTGAIGLAAFGWTIGASSAGVSSAACGISVSDIASQSTPRPPATAMLVGGDNS